MWQITTGDEIKPRQRWVHGGWDHPGLPIQAWSWPSILILILLQDSEGGLGFAGSLCLLPVCVVTLDKTPLPASTINLALFLLAY